jgi:hypothetical protein
MRIHLDTDLGSDTDDACALVGWPDVESRNHDRSAPEGRRGASVAPCCRSPVATTYRRSRIRSLAHDPRSGRSVVDDEQHWPTDIEPKPPLSRIPVPDGRLMSVGYRNAR